jgi:hypothetical protein
MSNPVAVGSPRKSAAISSARRQTQKIPVGKFHGVPSLESTLRHKDIALATISQEVAALRDFEPAEVGLG